MGKLRTFCTLATLTLALVAIAPAAMADPGTHTITRTGRIKLAHGPYNAITALGAACNPTSPLNGLDGVWYQIPSGATEVTLAPNYLLDADLLFRSARKGSIANNVVGDGCLGTGDDIIGDGYGHVVSGPIPAGASYVLVNGWLGAGCFTITFS